MGRKSRKKKIDNMWNDCLAKSKQATEAQSLEAKLIFSDLNKRVSLVQKEQYSKALNAVFDEHGDLMGSLVMVEFAKSQGFI
ncbi:hypothetical protein [Vibrio vulnificus]|uniref:hypothetical protein n=1 Tax=Vibrio vulnificus TaxID=672 RepID=UPI003EDA6CE2